MKALKLVLLMIFFAKTILAQHNGTLFLSAETLKKYSYSYELDQYRLEHLYPERFSNTGWKYRPGDDARWKEASHNDSDWIFLPTDFNLNHIPQDTWRGIGWFRLKLIIDSSLYNQALAVVMTHYGASEIYLDGILINQYGIPDKNPEVEKPFRPLFLHPVMISLDNKPEHLLAVRYSFQNAHKLFDKYGSVFWPITDQNGFAGFRIHFADSRQATDLFGDSLTKNLLCGIITLIALLLIGSFHFFLYLFYLSDRFNLFMAIFNFTLAGHSFTKFLPTYTHLTLQPMMLDNFLNIVFGCFWLPVSMLAYYSLFYTKLPGYVWLYFIATPLMAYGWIFDPSFGDQAASWSSLILFLDMMRLFIKSVLKKERYMWIIGLGVLLSQLTLVAYLIPSMSQVDRYFLLYPVFLAVPITMSIVNAIRTARTSKNLQNQLTEVNRLSEISLLQEQEKQQILASQKETLEQQVQERTAQLKQSLEDLKSTQSQLIQSEKMASLGELTAGIAHEIQNPLNFVNNFSEVNDELIDELKQEWATGNMQQANKLADDIKQNLEKVSYHGRRADAIVKGMLQHSRTSSGLKEPTDINALCDEYLRLAYHGFRAKDKSFNATPKTDFDNSIGKIEMVPQEMGRVILNLINNAFYAVNQKQKQNLNGYEPNVVISTRKSGGRIEICVKDNGNGIPGSIKDKIFQPFFTTKPAGQGTGLGLSLAYDIVKVHGGEIGVETKEGEGSEFIIQLPAV